MVSLGMISPFVEDMHNGDHTIEFRGMIRAPNKPSAPHNVSKMRDRIAAA